MLLWHSAEKQSSIQNMSLDEITAEIQKARYEEDDA